MMRRFGVDDPAKIGNFMAKGLPEREFPPEIAPEATDIIIEKSTPNLFVGTNVEMILRNRGIQTLVFTGIATEIGIETSVRDAGARGFYPVVVSDAVSSADREAHERSLKSMARISIVATMTEVQRRWQIGNSSSLAF
jgi:nicotinamidase-related amidase